MEWRGYQAAIRRAGFRGEGARVLTPRWGEFEARSGDGARWALISYALGAALVLIMILLPTTSAERFEQLRRRRARVTGVMASLRRLSGALLVLRGTALLAAANVLVFAAMVLSGDGLMSFRSANLVAWGANHGPSLHGIGWLRLASSLFVHGGAMHLVNNLYGLIVAGLLLEPVAGVKGWRLALLYLGTGVGGSLASVLAHPTGTASAPRGPSWDSSECWSPWRSSATRG